MKFEQYLIESEIEDLKKELKDSDGYLKAPNGKKSNLPEKQWLMVRTKAFKKWFGDWEADPENASQVVDKNCEPMIMYHVSDAEFTEFKASWRGIMFFAKTEDGARRGTVKGDNNTYKVFLNCRKIKGKTGIFYGDAESKKYQANILKQGFDAINVRDESKGTIAVFHANQIKSIDNNGSFSKSSNHINESKEELKTFVDNVKEKYGVQLSLITKHGNMIELFKIVVPKENRNDGVGTKVMNEIIKWADDHKKTITLTPSADFGGNKTKLVKFYKKFGFVENKGSTTDYEISDTMYRYDRTTR